MDSKKQHRDKDGDFTGSSSEVDDLLGGRHVEHRDAEGNVVGSSEKRDYLLGGEYTQHFDSQNNPSGTSVRKESLLGDGYTQHYDSNGKAIGRSEAKTGLLGNEYIEHRDENGNYLGTTTPDDASMLRRENEQPRSYISSIGSSLRPSSTDNGNGLGFLIALVLGLALLMIFIYVGVPILAGYWSARFSNRKWINPLPDRHRWRWVILPSVFTLVALTTNELIATGVGALQCAEPQSLGCSNYRRNPAPTVLGLHRQLVQQNGMVVTSPQQQTSVPVAESHADTSSPTAYPSSNTPDESQLTSSAAVRLIDNWLGTKPRIFAPPFDASTMQDLIARGPLWHDITKPGGSMDWLRSNNSHYVYHSTRVNGVQQENLVGSNPTLTVSVYEDSTIHSPKGAKRSESTRNYTYTFAKEDGHWKIYDYN